MNKFFSVLLIVLMMLSSNIWAERGQSRGILKPLKQAILSSEISAKIIKMSLRSGDSFKVGDHLITFDCNLFEAQFRKVKAVVRSAQLQLENNRKLEQRRSIGMLEVKLSEVLLEQRKAELDMVFLNVQRCEISAPWSGRVVKRMSNEHESVELNQELISIVSTDQLEVELVIPAIWVQWLKSGMSFVFEVDETGERIKSTILVVGSVVDAASQTIKVRGSLDYLPSLLPGMSGNAYFQKSLSNGP